MNDSQNTNEETNPSDKDALPIGEPVSPQVPNPLFQSIPQPTDTQENIAGQPPIDPSEAAIEKELGEFERLTLRWSRINVIVIAATLVAIMGTGVVFWDQFQEMAAQTNLLGIAARQARRDSAEASLATAKQLAIAELQAKAAQASVKAIQRQTFIAGRPWIGLKKIASDPNANFLISRRGTNGLTMSVSFEMENYGHSPAIRTTAWFMSDFVPNEIKPKFTVDELLEKSCEEADKQSTSSTAINPETDTGTNTVFPGEGGVISKDATVFAHNNNSSGPESASHRSPFRVRVFGCIAYQTAVEGSRVIHHTKLLYLPRYLKSSRIPGGRSVMDIMLVNTEAD